MKIILITLTFIFAALTGISQDKPTRESSGKQMRFGVCIEDALSNRDFCGFEFAESKLINIIDPLLVIDYKRHSFSIGPRFVFKQRNNGMVAEPPNLGSGIEIGTKYFFKELNKESFKFYICSNASYLKLKYNSFSSGYNGTWHANHFNIETGIGLKGTIIKNLYFQTAWTIGFTAFRNIAENVQLDDPTFHDNGDYEIAIMSYIRVGLGYTFGK